VICQFLRPLPQGGCRRASRRIATLATYRV
jgi:hypothetical protein